MAKQSYLPSSNQEERRVGGERKKLRERERESGQIYSSARPYHLKFLAPPKAASPGEDQVFNT
jgi:hypothetical protein